MSCASCGRNKRKTDSYTDFELLKIPPLNAGDIQIYANNEVHRLAEVDWPESRHKLLLFIPDLNNRDAQELADLSAYLPAFDELSCDVFVASSDQIHLLRDFIENELGDSSIKGLSSYILPTRLGILANGRTKRATIFIAKEGDVIRIEHLENVSRSLSELHRMVYAHVHKSFMAEGWIAPLG